MLSETIWDMCTSLYFSALGWKVEIFRGGWSYDHCYVYQINHMMIGIGCVWLIWCLIGTRGPKRGNIGSPTHPQIFLYQFLIYPNFLRTRFSTFKLLTSKCPNYGKGGRVWAQTKHPKFLHPYQPRVGWGPWSFRQCPKFPSFFMASRR